MIGGLFYSITIINMALPPQTIGDMLEYIQKMLKDWTVTMNTPLIHASDIEGNEYQYVYYPIDPMFYDPKSLTAIVFDDYVENHYDELKSAYKEMLRDTGKYHGDLDSVEDGRTEFVYESMREDSEWVFTCCVN